MPSTKKPAVAPKRSAVTTVVAVVSAINLLAFLVFGLVPWLLTNSWVFIRVSTSYVALFELVNIIVLAASWRLPYGLPSARRVVLDQPVRPGIITVFSMMGLLIAFVDAGSRHPVSTVYNVDAWPSWVAAAAVLFGLLCLQRIPTAEFNDVPHPTRTGRVLSVVSMAAFGYALLLSTLAGWVHLPVAALWVHPIILFGLVIASLFPHNRFSPEGPFGRIRAVTAGQLGQLALASLFVQLPLAVLFGRSGSGISLAFAGMALLVVTFFVGVAAPFFQKEFREAYVFHRSLGKPATQQKPPVRKKPLS